MVVGGCWRVRGRSKESLRLSCFIRRECVVSPILLNASCLPNLFVFSGLGQGIATFCTM